MSLSRRSFLRAGIAFGAAPGFALADPLAMRPPVRPAIDAGRVVAAAGLAGEVGHALLDARGDALSLGLAARRMAPASTMKAITAAFALDRLGPTHRFRTQILRDGDALVLVGGGDPVLSTDDLAALADALVASGVTTPARFTVWGGALPQLPQITPEQSPHLAYNPSISGMVLNFNRVHLGWGSGGAGMQLQARASRESPRAYTVTAAAADQAALFGYRADEDREYWTVSRGAIRRAGSRWLPVRLPELYAADVFQTLCRARGLVLPAPEIAIRAPQGPELAGHDSPPVLELVRDMLKFSTNLTAEVLGLHASGRADLGSSGAAMQEWLGDAGQGMRLADHSGLSSGSRISAFGMARILAGPGRDLDLPSVLKRNPLSEDLGADPAQTHEVRAKTGTLNFVSNLAGYVTTRGGQQGVFAIFCADPARRDASVGAELPAGVSTWTRAAKSLQRDVIAAFEATLQS
ncbi:D-alanyl-D-alanine carboxypeptidase/D-alanyl-D-alanine endopeptidase [Paracoccus zeaxanthinifaciens]|uniref:D-alanyl-D-alanine carboxypeptidase/D-alanyl-D-alanine endopeptidase n=1 Tax=Paracoccus zeaxanthinifaciens TaxID=187400 RepID=UPI0003B6C961|nr:D-alanyl-D-alanine carboxypeptidase/D-alanyl-D-alanine-endopeptidase [Paracoccus zeaxanthinifaciens]